MSRRFNLVYLAAAALTLAACASHAPEPKGPYRALNAGRWEPTADDLSESRPGKGLQSRSLNYPDRR